VLTQDTLRKRKEAEDFKQKTLKFIIAGIVAAVVFFAINGIDVRGWIETPTDMFLITIMTVGAYFFIKYQNEYLTIEKQFKSLRELLVKRLDANFCNCGKPCDHKNFGRYPVPLRTK
jgi:hypothetical protein